MPPFKLLPYIHETDFADTVQMLLDSMKDDEPLATMMRGVDRKVLYEFIKSGFTARLTRPGAETIKIVDEENGKIASFFIIQRPYVKTEEQKAQEMALLDHMPEGINVPLALEFFAIVTGIRERNGYHMEKDYMGNMICTAEEYRRQGHASRLLEAALTHADRDGASWYAACWPLSAGLYEKPQYGFEYITKEEIDMSKYGGEGMIAMKMFIRKPKLLN